MHRAAFLLVLLQLPAAAQTALTIQPQHCVWRAGDDPAWAAPQLDESGWQPTSQWSPVATLTPVFWLRCRFDPSRLAPAVDPELQVSGDLAWQVFADGRMIGQSGNLATGAHTTGMVVDYDAPELSQRNQPLLVAVRMSFAPEIDGNQPLPQLALGDAGLQTSNYWSSVFYTTREQWVTWTCYALIASAGLFFLALFWFDRSQRYVLWISLSWLALADLRINEFLVSASVHYPVRAEYFLYAIGQFMPVFIILFFFSLNRRPLPRAFQLLLGINFAFALGLLAAAFLPLHLAMKVRWWIEINPWSDTADVVVTIASAVTPVFAFWPLHSLRKGQIPLAAVCFVWMLMDLAYFVVQFPFLHLDVMAMFMKIQPFRSLAIAIVVVLLTLLLVQQLRATNRERAAMAGELQAARQIQQLLVPGAVESAAGWNIDTVFLPAREVGGDFYLCRVLPHGRLRIVLGDVSGKGTAAAMTAALLIGAAERRESDSPAELLHHLNLVLRDSRVGGFATCLCADLDQDGAVRVSNAGHLAPYQDGTELPVENGLPLGLEAGVSYPESDFQFAAGARLTFLTDGVVEARNAQGELFGFERAAHLSTGSAENVAQAAQHFGQQDDITVLTLSFAPVEALYA